MVDNLPSVFYIGVIKIKCYPHRKMEIRAKNMTKNIDFTLFVANCLYFPFPCVYREEDTPSSIPNLAVKLLFADDTALCKCGNVGRCRDWGDIFLNTTLLLLCLNRIFTNSRVSVFFKPFIYKK